MTHDNLENLGDHQPGRPRYVARRIIIVTIIIVIGVATAQYLIKTKPKVNRRPAEKIAPLVTVVPLRSASQIITVRGMGTVIPAREIVLKTPVGGEILNLHDNFSPGGVLEEGATILRIDPRDYELALQQRERAQAEAEYAYKLELGRQDVAQREWDLLYGGEKDGASESDLALRKPHLEKVLVDVKAAGAEVELAKLNLARTTVKAPFNALILNRYVDKGAFVAPQEKLADIVGTDEYWVQVSVPLDYLRRLKIPMAKNQTGSPARIVYRQDFVREGRVIGLMGDLTKQGRMARLLVAVPDPLGLARKAEGAPPLIIGEYVRVEIEGEELQGVFRLPRSALRNDREIWIVTPEETLDIRPVETVWRDEEYVLVRDRLQTGDLLVVSNLAVPVDGMAVRIDKRAGEGEQLQPGQAEGER